VVLHYSEIHNNFKINNSSYLFEELKEVAYSHIKEGLAFERIIGDFLVDWLNDKDFIIAQTSGSTGVPKQIKLYKQAMVNSAIATGNYFKLKPRDKALHCLPTQFIAGKMMLVRAMVLGLEIDIVEPTSQPVFDYKKHYDFCAMVPLQAEKSIDKLKNIKTLIIGGAAVTKSLKEKLQSVTTKVYETYGMTETSTHIAVRKLNSDVISSLVEKSHFTILPNITISKDDRDCLVIEAPKLFEGKLITNDLVRIESPKSFQLLGRQDSVINSGGIKLIPEQIEKKLAPFIQNRFIITSEADKHLGKKVILIIEANSNMLETSIFNVLDKYEKPKKVYAVKKFIETASGKVQRELTKEAALSANS